MEQRWKVAIKSQKKNSENKNTMQQQSFNKMVVAL